ncbi:ParB/Srx family N-terminal domain-containing protein [Schauerella aestuarii]|uniref:ParB/Srx family N-terminal domain-containing protein n=1 Tax=Schauerella aestuarii TaxID=2511204 RepID=UPI00136F5D88|nr:ParB/Srx family N-terminal domain-containing protein [Achromobacter aestuarii]MYZ42329.1 chromosome partitioning protein ParB [Achromobacter aestuarii]
MLLHSSFPFQRLRIAPLAKCLFAALLCAALAACGGDDDDDPVVVPPPVVTPLDPTPGPSPELPADPVSPFPPAETPEPLPEPEDEAPTPTEPEPSSPYLDSAVGDVIKIALGQLRPTQAAVGYDQIYYHLARKQPDMARFTPSPAGYLGDDELDNYSRYLYRSERKRADDYCADNGQTGLDDASYQPHTVRLIDANTFRCLTDPPTAGSANAQALKTVVVGPGGVLYLTDGHHTFTVLNELADGGALLPVWVRVAANYSDAESMPVFWSRMRGAGFVWLRDAADRVIEPSALPPRVALANFQDDAYRSLVYLTRGLGYSNNDVSEFAEFSWGSWLRRQGFDLTQYDLASLDRSRITVTNGVVAARSGDATSSYVAAVRDAALRMVATRPDEPIAPERSAEDLGRLNAPAKAGDWNDVMEDDIWRADVNSSGRYRTAGKAWFAVRYRQCGGPAAAQPACWAAAQ